MITARGSDVTELPNYARPRWFIRRALAGADGLIGVSSALRDRLIDLGADPARTVVLRNGVDTASFHPVDRDAARAALGLTGPTLVSVGALVERKGHHRTIEAMLELPDFSLLIIGEGPERAALAAQIIRLGLAERVRLLGPHPHARLVQFYGAADAMVLASSREGWANVLLESMACGTPVVASNIPGNPEVVREPAAGLVVESNTPAGLAADVRSRLFADPPARAATRAYAERFGWEETSAGQLALCRRVLGRDAVSRIVQRSPGRRRPGAGLEKADNRVATRGRHLDRCQHVADIISVGSLMAGARWFDCLHHRQEMGKSPFHPRGSIGAITHFRRLDHLAKFHGACPASWAALLAALHRLLCLERGQIATGDNPPYDVGIDPVVFVAQHIADAADVSPWLAGHKRFSCGLEFPRRLADDKSEVAW